MTLSNTDARLRSRHDWNRNYDKQTWKPTASEMEWIRRLAADVRQRAGITGEPNDEELDRAAEVLGIKVVYAAVAVPYCVYTPQGPMIVRPHRWQDEHGNPYPHEIGHGATNPGGGEVIRAVWPGSPRHERLAQHWARRDELYAEEFAKALSGQ